MNFDHNTFSAALDAQPGITIIKQWYQWNNTSGDLNKTMEYSKDNFGYRTWYHETSVMSNAMGMLVSCKIDFERTTGDDHIILLTGFSISPAGVVMKFAQASVQFHGSESNNIIGTPVTSGDMAQGIYNSLSSILSADFGSIDDSTAGRKTLPDIARANIQAIQQAAG